MSHTHSYKVTVKKLPETGEIEIKSSLSAEEFGGAIKEALKDLTQQITIPGFRKGTAPEKMVREKIGNPSILTEAAERAISHAYSHILEAEEIDAIGYPKVNITKIAEGNPLEFTIITAVVPEITNFDYSKIAAKENGKKKEEIVVSEEEVVKTIETIQKNYAAGKTKEIDANAPVPELTDALVKTWGDFKDVADFKIKLKENIAKEKDHKAMEKRRIELVDALTGGVSVTVPEVLIETELGRMVEQMKHDIERMGLTFDDYLKHLKKTADDLKKEWRADATKRVKLDLALNHIAKKEKIIADPLKVEEEVKHAQEHHKDVDADRARNYFSHIFQNQAVFEFLEKQK